METYRTFVEQPCTAPQPERLAGMDSEVVEDRHILDKAILLLMRPLELRAAKVQHLDRPMKDVPETVC